MSTYNFRSSLRYRNESEAAIAHLAHRHQLPHRFLDDLLRTLTQPTFQTADISFRKAADIDAYISDYRKSQAAARSQDCDDRKGFRLPSNVLECIAEHIEDDMGPISKEFEGEGQRDAMQTRKTLVAMSLVYRSWTDAAHVVLRRRIVLRSCDSVREFLVSPHCGPWVRELAYLYSPPGPTHTSPDWALLSELIARFPQLEYFFMKVHSPGHMVPCNDDILAVDRVIEKVGQCESLKGVWIHADKAFANERRFLEMVYYWLSQARSLSFLSLRGFCQPDGDSPNVSSKLPPRSLKVFACEFDLMDPTRYCYWTTPQQGFKLPSLHFHFLKDSELIPRGEGVETWTFPASDAVTNLHMSFSFSGFDFSARADLVRFIASRCKVLQSLHLYNAPVRIPLNFQLPATLRRLHLGFTTDPNGLKPDILKRQLEHRDEGIVHFLQQQNVRLQAVSIGVDKHTDFLQAFAHTRTHCLEAEIAFTFNSVTEPDVHDYSAN